MKHAIFWWSNIIYSINLEDVHNSILKLEDGRCLRAGVGRDDGRGADLPAAHRPGQSGQGEPGGHTHHTRASQGGSFSSSYNEIVQNSFSELKSKIFLGFCLVFTEKKIIACPSRYLHIPRVFRA